MTYRMMWTGETFQPAYKRVQRDCDRELVVGQVYSIEVIEDRSEASHRHFFACIDEAWHSLPAQLDGQWPTVTHFRKAMLIKAGWCTHAHFVCRSQVDALRAARDVQGSDEYAVVNVDGPVIEIWRARSMATRGKDKMGRDDFQRVKEIVFRVIFELTGVALGEEYERRSAA